MYRAACCQTRRRVFAAGAERTGWDSLFFMEQHEGPVLTYRAAKISFGHFFPFLSLFFLLLGNHAVQPVFQFFLGNTF